MQAENGTAIRARGLRMAYGSHEAVRGVDFDVRVGEVFAFLGPNGAGKTTTIEILEGYRRRTAGDVSVLGVDPARPTRSWRARIGLVLQECELGYELTVREMLSMFASFYPQPRDVDETIELVGLADKRDARVGTLSGGQRRRADVAIGVIGDPELIFLDEPTTGFDPTARRGAWAMIEGLRELGKTVFLTTHYMDEAQRLADRVAILRDGELAAIGTTAEIGASLGERTRVRFLPPAELDREHIEAITGERATLTDGIVTISSADPQRTLYLITAWANERGVTLEGLEAVRPSLEDMFLELTAEEPQR